MYQMVYKQLIPTDMESCWRFFSAPNNLSAITPKKMNFRVLTPENNTIYPGQIIAYKVSPLLGISLRWVTEITYVEPGKYFVDEQRIGPYRLWHHEHHFEQKEEGIYMTDKISYQLPFGFLGRFVHLLLVKRQLELLFNYRKKAIEQYFSKQ